MKLLRDLVPQRETIDRRWPLQTERGERDPRHTFRLLFGPIGSCDVDL